MKDVQRGIVKPNKNNDVCLNISHSIVFVINPSNAEATFVQSTRMQRFLKKTSKPRHVGIHWIVLIEYSQMSTHVPGFQSFFTFLHNFPLPKLATSSIRVKLCSCALLCVCFWYKWVKHNDHGPLTCLCL